MTFINDNLIEGDVAQLAKESLIRIGDSCQGDRNYEILAAVLRITSKLQTLQLDSSAALRNDKFISALASNTTIRFLNLRSSCCDDTDAAALAANVLKNNATLQTISLNDNNISDVGAKALAEALMENNSIQKLYLNDNQISDEGAGALAASQNGVGGVLRIISLSGNALTNVIESSMNCGYSAIKIEPMVSKKTSLNTLFAATNAKTIKNKVGRHHDNEMGKLLEERKVMQQQLDNLSTDRDEARGELAAKDAIIKMKDEKILTHSLELNHYQKRVDKIIAEKQTLVQQLKDELTAKEADTMDKLASKDVELEVKNVEISNLQNQLIDMKEAKNAVEAKSAELRLELQLKDELIRMKDDEAALLRDEFASKDAELEVKNVEISILRKQLNDMKEAKDAEEAKSAELRLESQLKDELIRLRVEEVALLRNQIEIQHIEFGAEQQRSKQHLDRISEDMAATKAREESKGVELTSAKNQLRAQNEELAELRKRLDDLTEEIGAKKAELKATNIKLSDYVSRSEKLQQVSDEMKLRVERLSLENEESANTIANLTTTNEDLCEQKSQLTSQVSSLTERLKCSREIDMVDLTSENEEGTKISRDSQQEDLPPLKRCRMESDSLDSFSRTTDEDEEFSVEKCVEKHKFDTIELFKHAKLRGEKGVSSDSLIRARQVNSDLIKRANPSISDQEVLEAFANAEQCAHKEYIQSLL